MHTPALLRRSGEPVSVNPNARLVVDYAITAILPCSFQDKKPVVNFLYSLRRQSRSFSLSYATDRLASVSVWFSNAKTLSIRVSAKSDVICEALARKAFWSVLGC